MKSSGASKFVRALAVVAAVCLLLSIPRKSETRGAGRGSAGLDLLPNITRGLDLVAPSGGSLFVYDPDGPGGAEQALKTELPGNESGLPLDEGPLFVDVFTGDGAVELPLEEYIIGVTAAEMPASYHSEALKAQAIAARTFTLKHIVREARCRSGHTICTDPSCCQAYITVEQMRSSWGARFDEYYAKIRDAVLSTEGVVLKSGGELVTALYHSSSGGRTEDCEAVFAVALPYLVSVESEGEEDSPEFMAEKVFTDEEFMEIINTKFPDAAMTDPKKDVEVWQRTESGRIALIRLGGTVRTGQQLRNALKLHSTNAEFDFSGNTVRVTCFGFGHGVGMSQCGANAMARQGADHEEILKHYYTGVELCTYEP